MPSKQRKDSSETTSPRTRISKARKDLLAQYATAAVLLYGVMSVSEFVDVFNHYEYDQTNEMEVRSALKRSPNDDVEYSLFGDLVSGPDFLLEYPDELENAEIVRAEQKDKPRYLPDKDEFLRYRDASYREPEKPYTDLKSYILTNGLCSKEGLHGVDGDLIDLHEMIQSGFDTAALIHCFVEKGYPFDSMDKLNAFIEKIVYTYNHTRLFENNGFTPTELFEKYAASQNVPSKR